MFLTINLMTPKKLQFLYVTENRWSPWVYPPGWVRSPTIHHDIVILLFNRISIYCKGPNPNNHGFTWFSIKKAWLYNKHGPIFCNPNHSWGSKGHFLAQVRFSLSSSPFWKKSWADFGITPPPPTKKTQPQPAECQSTIPAFILSSPSGFKSFSSTPSLDSGACCGTSGEKRANLRGNKLDPVTWNPKIQVNHWWMTFEFGNPEPSQTNTQKPLDFLGVDLRYEGLTCIDGCASLHWLNDLEAKTSPSPFLTTPRTQNACI